jgi:hypothetical protein
MKNAFAHNAFAASGGISQTAADARYVLKAAGSFTGLTGAGFRDTSAAFDVTMGFASSTALTEARSITWDVKNASHSLKFTAASIVTFPAGTNTLLGSAVANTITANGAASTPALLGSGTIFTGGTATTTKPYWLIEPTGTTSTGWSTSGTLLGINGPSGFGGMLFEAQQNGSSRFQVSSSQNFGWGSAGSSIVIPNFGGAGRAKFCGSSGFFSDGSSSFAIGTAQLQWNSSSTGAGNTSPDTGLARASAAAVKVTDGSSGYGSIDASAYKVGGVAGVSFSGVATNLTFVNGLCTAAS